MSKLTKEERLSRLDLLNKELQQLNEEEEAPPKLEEEPTQEIEDVKIEKPKRKATVKQLEAMKKGNAILRQKQADAKKIKEEQAIVDKEILNKKIVEKAIKIKKKQIKQNKILYETDSESETDETIQRKHPAPALKPKPKPEPLTVIKSRFKFIN